MKKDHYDVVVTGSGIAGLSAAVYTSRGGNDTLVIRGDEPGGQLTLTTEVANYPGFPETVGGQELVKNIEEQCKKFGTEMENGFVVDIEDKNRPFEIELKDGTTVSTDSVIVASGASARTLGVEGEDELMGYGVSTCATCDGAFFRGEDMIVVGGGDAAFEEALFLTKFANKVHIVHRREGLRADQYLQDQVNEKVEEGEIELMLNTELIEIEGSKEDGVDTVDLATNPEGYPTEKLEEGETEIFSMDVGAVFMAIGHTPNTGFLEDTGVKLNDSGYINLPDYSVGDNVTQTDVKGIFAAGDVFDHHYQQAATAAGSGVKAAMDANDYLERNN